MLILGLSCFSIVRAEQAIFAMGCFWCAESEFRDHVTHANLPGIQDIKVGYAGGTIKNPTYLNHPGYKEVVKLEFDPNIITYEKLLDIFWHNVDLYDADGQFCDQGFSYTSAIYYTTPEQKIAADKSKRLLELEFNKPIETEIIPATTYYDAEEYHQDYAAKNTLKYNFYRWNCGRDQRLKEIWGKE